MLTDLLVCHPCEYKLLMFYKISTLKGLPNKDIFLFFLNYVTEKVKKTPFVFYGKVHEESRKGRNVDKYKKRKLSREQELLITLIILRKGVHQDLIGVFFDISQSTVSRIFNTYIRILGSDELFETFVDFVNVDIIRQDMPPDFDNITRIMDAFELKVERPASMEIAPFMWSNYKKYYGVKFLIACTPLGLK